RRALAENRIEEAERLAREALDLLPAEANFHALAGDIEMRRGRPEAAIAHYERAIARNDAFFYFPLQQGIAEHQLGRMSAADASLQASVQLLPTADAYLTLGKIAEQRGDRAAALERYAQAAGSSSPSGQAAQDAIIRLDLPQNPEKYL